MDNDKVAYGKMQGISPAILILALGDGIWVVMDVF
jgi:hypothetical protein